MAEKETNERQKESSRKMKEHFESTGLLWSVYLRAAHPKLKMVEGVDFISAKDVAVMLALHQVAEGVVDENSAACRKMAEYAGCAECADCADCAGNLAAGE